MNPRGRFVAELLDASASALAARATTRLAERGPAHRKMVDTWGFRRVALDLEARLTQLAEALAVGRPELFLAEIGWVAASLAGRGVPVELLNAELEVLAEELEGGLPREELGPVLTMLQGARVDGAAPVERPATLLPAGEPFASLSRRLLLAAVEGQRWQARAVVDEALAGGHDLGSVYDRIVPAVLAEVGRLWQAGELSVALEHLASRTIEDLLAALRHGFAPPAPDARSVLLASIPGNLHDIGLRLVGDRFERTGWRVVFLGANVPTPDLLEALGEFAPDLLGLSAGTGLHLRATAAAIESARKAGWTRPILVGGRAFGLVADLWRDVGADGEARDAASAVHEGTRLVAG